MLPRPEPPTGVYRKGVQGWGEDDKMKYILLAIVVEFGGEPTTAMDNNGK